MTLARRITAVAAASGAAAALNQLWARTAEHQHPPEGRFVEAGGLRMHVVERGSGAPVIYLHGNGGSTREVAATGLIGAIAERHRVIVPDRPGFGHTRRDGDPWPPERQADLIASLLGTMNAVPALVMAHSWGTLVATALAIRHPGSVRGMVLISGFYYPETRADAALGLFALPVVGSLIRHTIGPPITRVLAPVVIKKVFAPNAVTEQFEKQFPTALAARPSQLQAVSEENAMLVSAAGRLCGDYHRIGCPVLLLAGGEDRLVDTDRHSARAVSDMPHAALEVIEDVGHMLPHLERQAVMEALARVEQMAVRPRRSDADAPAPAIVPPARATPL
ncbi:MAG: alpha/beta hydrolase [Hyphomicrobiaceae bacterium]|nr:alpha/beta hydrolase [Hyphomicrobiaceae bacterium]